MFAKNGLQNLVERAKLGRFLLQKFSSSSYEKYSIPERVRMCFEELGPTFVKFGQLLAVRPDLVPFEFIEEFKKLHDQVPAVEFSEIQKVLIDHYGQDLDQIFTHIDKKPIGAASIAQVYRAQLASGEQVVIKVQRPGIESVIFEDLSVLYTLAELIENHIEEAKIYNPLGIVDEFYKALQLEIDFMVEANNLRKFAENFKDDERVHIPKVYTELSAKKVLVMEALDGVPLSHPKALKQEGIDRKLLVKVGLGAYLKMVFNHGLFHGDLHAGNMFVMKNNQIGLVDFGVVGRLNKKTQGAIANMFIAMASEDYEKLAYEYVELAPYSESVDVDYFAKDLRDLFSPYYGLTLKHVNLGKLLLDSSGIAARYQLVLPSELVLFFKSIISIEGMGRSILDEFDFLSESTEFAADLIKARYEPKKVAKDLLVASKDLNSVLIDVPRQLRQLLRRANHPEFALKVDVKELEALTQSIDSSAKSKFIGMVVAALILSSTAIIIIDKGPYIFGLPALSILGYSIASFFTLIYLLK